MSASTGLPVAPVAPVVPVARVAPESGWSWTRLLPLVALAFALFLVRAAWRERGPRIAIHAADGHGLRPGDALRYRGIDVGRVESLALDESAHEVVLEVRLARSASALARSGARFWIARPVLGVEGVRGLETALGARYLAVLPGASDAPFQREFTALEEPPLSEAEDAAALEIVLQADERGGLARGAPVLFRGIPIGTLVSVALADDATTVEARARIHPEHAELVRVDSRFYRTRGAELSFGLGGLELAVDSLQSLWLGGVALATPTHPGARASTGQRFELAAEAEDEWRTWRPALALGAAGFPDEAQVPERVWGRLSYDPRGWFQRSQARGGWLVRGQGELLGPADLLVLPEGAKPESAVLELGGERLTLAAAPVWSGGGLARRIHPGDGVRLPAGGPALGEPADVLLCADPVLAPMAVAATHLERDGLGWRVSPRIALDERWHGAVVLTRADGRWVGILLVAGAEGRIVPLPGG